MGHCHLSLFLRGVLAPWAQVRAAGVDMENGLATRTLDDFLGHWTITRRIQQDDGAEGRFDGRAAWRLEGGGAIYTETGQFWLAGQGPFHAERRYRWGADLTVYFDDGRLFHVVPPAGGDVAHWCPPDQYDGSYDFRNWPLWEVAWRVHGPRKAYTSFTRYSPAEKVSS